MRNILAILSILLFSNALVNAQMERPGAHEVNIKGTYLKLKNTFRKESHLSYVKILDQHALNFSVIFTLNTDHAETSSNSPRPTGLGIDYSYNIPCTLNTLEISFSAGISYRLIPNTWSGNYYSEQQVYVPINTNTIEHFTDLRLGYGFRFWIGNHFFMGPNLQGGIFYSKLNYGGRKTNTDIGAQEVEHDFRRYGDIGWLIQGSFIIGYRF